MAWNDVTLTSGAVPLWFQIANILRAAIRAAEFVPGDHLPSEAELNRLWGVSRTTARTALDKLEQEGLIVRKNGRGSIVVEPKFEQPINLLAGFSEDMRRRNLKPGYATLSTGFVSLDEEARLAFGEDEGISAYNIQRLLLADGKPIGVSNSWIAPSILGDRQPPNLSDLDSGSLYAWLESHCAAKITGGEELIEAVNLDGATAKHLGVMKGTAALVARRLSRDPAQRPVEYAVICYRADRYRYRIDLNAGT